MEHGTPMNGRQCHGAEMNMLADRWYIGGLQITAEDRQYRAARPLKAGDKVVPVTFDNRQLVTPTEDQGDKPHCVAYSMTSLIESAQWQQTHAIVQLNPVPLYDMAKRIEGNNHDGTTFTSAFQAAIEIGYIPTDSRLHNLTSLRDVQYAIHEFGLCLLGLDVTEAWGQAASDGWIHDNGGAALGGHAVVGVGWDIGQPDWVAFKNSWGKWGAVGFGRLSVAQFNKRFLDGVAIEIPIVAGKGW